MENSTQTEMDPVEKLCMEQLETTVQYMEPHDKNNMFTACIRLMVIAETFKTIPGNRRKELVMEVMKKHLPTTTGGETVLPSFIDTAVSMDKGKLAITLPREEQVTGCIGVLFGKCLK